MLKYAMLTGAMMFAAPALAQATSTGQATPQTGTPQAQAAPQPGTDAAAMPADAAQAPPAQSVPADGSAAPAQAAATQSAGGDQVAQAVDQQFATYDKDGNGTLSRAEFADWMVTLKTQSDPKTKADSPATKQWVGAAFAQADKNGNKALSKTEVTGFLAGGQKG